MVGMIILTICTNNISAANKKTVTKATSIKALVGNYVTPEYFKRNKGYDWVAVTITATNDSTAHIRIRSRVDLKKATCTFDRDARLVGNRLISEYDGANIVYSVSKKGLTISTENKEDILKLNFFCSGGGTIAGNYTKLTTALDKKQLDKRDYVNFLSLGNYFFDINATGNKLTIQPIGFDKDNSVMTHTINGKVTYAEVDDLNNDGFPEVMVYIESNTKNKKASVIAYSSNKGYSMSQISIPDLANNPKYNKGFNGNDDFRAIEGNLYQRFPIYQQVGKTLKATGKYRQIKYVLKDGEASRVFVAEKSSEF